MAKKDFPKIENRMSKDEYNKIQSQIIIDFSKIVKPQKLKKLDYVKELDLG